MLTVRRTHTHAVISFVDEVSPESIIELVSTIDDLRDHFFYREVILQIDSPGGLVDALQYYIGAMRRWQQNGPTVETRALTSCASAGAVMLSFGHQGHRIALRSSRLHYHYARYSQGTEITRERAVHYIRTLDDADGAMLDCLVERAMQCERPSCNGAAEPWRLSEQDQMALKAIRQRLPEEHTRGDDDHARWLGSWLAEPSRPHEDDDKPGREGWIALYDALLKADCSISGTLAYRLRLIDKLQDRSDASRDVAATSPTLGRGFSRSFHIGEWSNVYPHGHIPFEDLRRHVLILGETGSGKTRSAVLPVLLAAYRSEEVSSILVIDPKRELHQELDSVRTSPAETSRRLELIAPETHRIDLLSGDQWSIKTLTDNRKYWSAAERILQRVARITAANPARILLGQPPVSSRDQIWERRGVKLATSVLAVAIECMAQPADIFGKNGAYDKHFGADDCDEQGVEEARNALREIGEAIGILQSEVPERYKKPLADARQQAREALELESAYRNSGGNPAVVPEDIEKRRYDALAGLLAQLMKDWDSQSENDSHGGMDTHSAISHKQFLYNVTRKLATMEQWGEKRTESDGPDAKGRSNVAEENDDIDWHDSDSDYPPSPEELSAWKKKQEEWEELEKGRQDKWKKFWELDLHRRFEGVSTGNLLVGQVDPPFDISLCFPEEELHRSRRITGYGAHCSYYSKDWDFRQLKEQTLEGISTQSILWLWRQGPQSGSKLQEFIEHVEDELRGHVEDELRVVELAESQEKQTPNVLMIAELLLQSLCQLGPLTDKTGLHKVAEVWKRRHGGEYARIGQALGDFANIRQIADKQYAGELGSTDNIWRELIADDVRTTLYFGCEAAFLRAGSGYEKQRPLDFFDDVRQDSAGTVYMYQPELSGSGALIAKAIKTMLFEAVLSDEDRRKKGTKMPLVGYVADEFQRFVTADHTHGEQSFLDTCRSFGAFAVLASQSIASLEYALCDSEPSELKLRKAVDIICTNTGTKLFFRSTDRDTIERLNVLCPVTPDGRIVTQARPLATLRPGECYITFPDGRFERAQLDQVPERDGDEDGCSI